MAFFVSPFILLSLISSYLSRTKFICCIYPLFKCVSAQKPFPFILIHVVKKNVPHQFQLNSQKEFFAVHFWSFWPGDKRSVRCTQFDPPCISLQKQMLNCMKVEVIHLKFSRGDQFFFLITFLPIQINIYQKINGKVFEHQSDGKFFSIFAQENFNLYFKQSIFQLLRYFSFCLNFSLILLQFFVHCTLWPSSGACQSR